jgi:beta-1,4-mannosyl-glycoprotein beta-1,4-N-acetylglucosaminyltransferase
MFNELDIAEIRIQENWDTTDYFVIAEASHTHAGNPKPYYLLENWERFKPYESKIRRIQIDESLEEQRKQFPKETDEWVREKYQRFALQKGLHDMQPEDLIIISDCDEVPRSEMIEMIKEDTNDYDRYILNVPHFHFRLNYMRVSPVSVFANILVCRGRAFTNPMREREHVFPWVPTPPDTVFIDHGGWHWSDFGNDEHVINKMKSFCHLDQNNKDIIESLKKLDWLIENKYDRDLSFVKKFEYVVVDDYFPKCITDNLDKWQHMIIPNATHAVFDIYDKKDNDESF